MVLWAVSQPPFPMDSKLKLSKTDSELLVDASSYRRLIGRLLYLTITRPDLSYSINTLAQSMDKLGQSHLNVAHHVLRYLKSTPAHGLFFPTATSSQLKGFCDLDWATCIDSRRSITSFCLFLGNSLVSWGSQKQSIVYRSSVEVEYRALASTSCEIAWFLQLLSDFRISHSTPTFVYCDNKYALSLAANLVHHAHTKHVEIDCHFNCEQIAKGVLRTFYIASTH